MERGASPDDSAEEQLRKNLLELLAFRRMNQTQFAELLGKSQSWVSKRLAGKESGRGNRFQLRDLDVIGHVFELSPAELLRPGYGKWDRRCGSERRSSTDRRQQHRQVENDRRTG